MDSTIFNGWLTEILVLIILTLFGIVWRDLNTKIKTLFKKHENFVTHEIMDVGVNADIKSLAASFKGLSSDLRNHMDNERIMYGVLAGIVLVGFSVISIALVIIYMDLRGG